MTCPRCGAETDPETGLCRNCIIRVTPGERENDHLRLTQRMRNMFSPKDKEEKTPPPLPLTNCPKCGKVNLTSAKACIHCGHEMEEQQ